jgi:hypothetical protein
LAECESCEDLTHKMKIDFQWFYHDFPPEDGEEAHEDYVFLMMPSGKQYWGFEYKVMKKDRDESFNSAFREDASFWEKSWTKISWNEAPITKRQFVEKVFTIL